MLLEAEADAACAVINCVLEARPELSPGVVALACPDLTYAPTRAITDRRSRGILKAIDARSGCGKISCPELQEAFGADVIVEPRQLNDVLLGADVNFAVLLTPENMPQAFDVQPSGSSSAGEHGAQLDINSKEDADPITASTRHAGGGPSKRAATPPKSEGHKRARHDAAGSGLGPSVLPGRYQGRIKSFSSKTGFGFIECDDLKAKGYENDAFLHSSQIGEYEVGQLVCFTAYINAKGLPQAKALRHIALERDAVETGRGAAGGKEQGGAAGKRGQDGHGDGDGVFYGFNDPGILLRLRHSET